MGACLSSNGKQAPPSTKREIDENAACELRQVAAHEQIQNIGSISAAADAEDSAVANVLAKPTHSGRFLLSATDQPLTPEQQLELAADMKDNPEAREKLAELAGAAQMGLKLQYAKSPAFVGLLIVDLQSAELSGFKTPEIQFVCEDDKANGRSSDEHKAHSEHLQPWQAAAKRGIDGPFGETEENGSDAVAAVFESAVADSLKSVENEPETMASLKYELASLFDLVSERLSMLEDKVKQQDSLIMELTYQLEKAEGKTMPYISGRFGYGVGRTASHREVLLFAKQAQTGKERAKWPTSFLGKYKTDGNGRLGPVVVPPGMATAAGHYDIVALLPEDNTFARGSLFILKPGTQCVLFDMDGTITVGDQEVVGQFGLNALAGSTAIGDRLLTQAWDQKARTSARTVLRLWAAKGYQVVYLSGRQGSFYNLTLLWLINHNFPPGPIHLTRTRTPTLPVYASVGNFKVQYMQELKAKGFELYAAYGNTGTDVRAYAAAGIPKERTFTLGQAAGSGGTIKVKNFTRHLPTVLKFPDAKAPIPYVDLLWAGVPTHRDSKSSAGGLGSEGSINEPVSMKKASLSASGVTTTDPSDMVEQDDVPVVNSVLKVLGGDDVESDDEFESTRMPGPAERQPLDNSGLQSQQQ